MRLSLRDKTYELHQRLEQLWTPQGHFDSISSYRRFLRLLLKAHSGVGLRAAASRGDPDELTLEQDRVLALSVDLAIPSPALPMPPSSMPHDYAWGVGYVLNGSALGASIILKNSYILQNWPSDYMTLGRSYVKTGRAKHFFKLFDSLHLDTAEVERGAIDTFLLFSEDGAERS